MSRKFNAINFSTDEDIVLTAIGFYTSDFADLLYDLFIYEVGKDNELQMIYNEKKVEIKMMESDEDNLIRKVPINELRLKAQKLYQIRQNIISAESKHFFGYNGGDNIVLTNAFVSFRFFACNIPSKVNSSTTGDGLIPLLFFKIDYEFDC